MTTSPHRVSLFVLVLVIGGCAAGPSPESDFETGSDPLSDECARYNVQVAGCGLCASAAIAYGAATAGTAEFLRGRGVAVDVDVAKLGDSEGLHAVELIERGEIQLVVNTPRGRGPRADGEHIRAAAGLADVPLVTTAAAAVAAAYGIGDRVRHRLAVRSLQEYHRGVGGDQLTLALGFG